MWKPATSASTVFEKRDSSTRRSSASPPHQSAPLTASPRGEACVLRWGDYYGIFLQQAIQDMPTPSPGGGRWAGPVGAGSDEGGRQGFHGVGNRRTSLRWQRNSTTHRSSTSPPHQSAPLTASPRGEAYSIRLRWGGATVVFYNRPYRFCQSPSPGGGRWAGPSGRVG